MICQCRAAIFIWCDHNASITIFTILICFRIDILESKFCSCTDASKGKFILLLCPNLFGIHLRFKIEAAFYSRCTVIQKFRINRKNHFIIFNFIRTCFCTIVVKGSLALIH